LFCRFGNLSSSLAAADYRRAFIFFKEFEESFHVTPVLTTFSMFSFLVFKDRLVAGFSPHLHVSMPTLEKLAGIFLCLTNLSSDKPWNTTEYSGLVSSAVLELNQRYYSTTDDAALERGAVDLIGGNCRDEYAMLYSLE
jgi:hypothetical protein